MFKNNPKVIYTDVLKIKMYAYTSGVILYDFESNDRGRKIFEIYGMNEIGKMMDNGRNIIPKDNVTDFPERKPNSQKPAAIKVTNPQFNLPKVPNPNTRDVTIWDKLFG